MRAMQVNFAPRSATQVIASMQPRHWLLAGIGFVLCLGGIVAMQNLTTQQAARQAELEKVLAQAAARSAPAAQTKKSSLTDAQISAVNRAIQQLNLPWSRLLTAIERATPANVALLELTPDAKRHLVKGVAEAKTINAMLAYIKRLKQQPFMGNVILTRHEISDKDANRPVRFEFEAEWRETLP